MSHRFPRPLAAIRYNPCMRLTMRIRALALCLLCCLASVAAAENDEPVRLGILAWLGAEEAEVQWARQLMLQVAPLVHRLPGRAGWELRLVVQGGLAILDKIAAQGFDTFSQRPTVGKADAPRLLWRAVWM